MREHAREAGRTAAAVRAVEHDVTALPARPGAAPLRTLIGAAVSAHQAALAASEWSPVSSSEAGTEEENVPRAEALVSEAADELLHALAAIESYARTGRSGARARYETEIARVRQQWDEGIAQLWFVARRRDPPMM